MSIPIQLDVLTKHVEPQNHTSECSNILSSKPIAVQLLETETPECNSGKTSKKISTAAVCQLYQWIILISLFMVRKDRETENVKP